MIAPVRLFAMFVVAATLGVAASAGTTRAQEDPPASAPTEASTTPTSTATQISTVATTAGSPIPLVPTTVAPSTVPGPAATNPPEAGVIALIATTTTTSTSTTVDPAASTSIDPNASSTTSSSTIDPNLTTTIPLLTDLADDDATPEPIPNPGFRPTLPATNIAPIRNITLEKLLLKLTVEQRIAVQKAQKAADAAQARVGAATAELDELAARQSDLKNELASLQEKAERSRELIRARGLRVYSGANVGELDALLRSEDSSVLARRLELLRRAQQFEADLMDTYEADQKEVARTLGELAVLAEAKRKELETVLDNERALNDALIRIQANFESAARGLAIAVNGWVFPVQPPFSFVDTFGAPRMFGTKYAHFHEGTDIFAPQGTPLRAVARGVIARKGQAVLGGNKLWLVAADGTQYYYAHLSAFVEGVDEGTVVEAGQIIGFVGNTGNATATPAHLHFEIHPNGGPAMNPFPTLDAVRRSDSVALAQAQKLQIVLGNLDATANAPGTYRAGIGVTREFAIGAVDASAAGVRSTLPPGTVTTLAPVRRLDEITTSSRKL